jgi:hypothetical protein
MPKFVIERQYLLPIYQRLIIDAPDIATACQRAVENDDWESAEEDGDGSRATTDQRRTRDPGRTRRAGRARRSPCRQLPLGRPAREWATPRYP